MSQDPKFRPIKRALISVADKTGIESCARTLTELGIELISTGGTARALRDAGLAVTDVSEVTGFQEMMDGRVKTLHPHVHAGILARRGEDDATLSNAGIKPIDLVIVNLYPFKAVTKEANVALQDAIENIDIGGPTMIRAAAKNCEDVAVVVSPGDYDMVLIMLREQNGQLDFATRWQLASAAFAHTADYDAHIANYFNRRDAEQTLTTFPQQLSKTWLKNQTLRYGENPHQEACFYQDADVTEGTLASSRLLQGKPLSYNNLADAEAALSCVKAFDNHACVIVKHANPCGIAERETQLAAYQDAFKTDSQSAFGGIIAFNQTLDAETAKAIISQQFAEVIIAPEITNDAALVLAEKKNLRVLACGKWSKSDNNFTLRTIGGGLLIQSEDTFNDPTTWQVVTEAKPSDDCFADCLFAWRAARFVKSNAIVYAKNKMTLGIGAGQMSRVDSARIAVIKAEHAELPLQNAVMASDAFFPFRDSIDAAAKAGITTIIQPGGSKRDEEVIQAANEHGIAMILTGRRHFLH